MTDFDAILDRLLDEGQAPEVLMAPGRRLLLSPRGARVLAVQADGLPVDPFYLADDADGRLTGGDRLWLGPEVAWFWPSLEKAREDPVKHAAVPAEIDPGEHRPVREGPGAVEFRCRMELTDARDGAEALVGVRRRIRLVDAPREIAPEVSAVSWLTSHELFSEPGEEPTGAVASAWSIAQLPPGGTLICPTVRPLGVEDDVTSYYDDFGPDHVVAEGAAVRFRVDATRRIKMGLKAEDTTGRMGYFREVGEGRATLILRFFPTLPGERYCDVPRSADASARSGGDCLQAYNDDLTYGPFGEMEHHDPAVRLGDVVSQSHSATTTVLAGPVEAVRAAGQRLLGVPV